MLTNKIFLSFLISSVFIVSCSTPSTIKNNDPIVKTESILLNMPKEEIKKLTETYIQFTQKIDGIDNPIAPDNITSIEIGNKIVEAKDIKIITNKFAIKAGAEKSTVEYLGSGKFRLNLEVNPKSDNVSLKFNLSKSKKSLSFPLLKGIIDNNIRISYDSDTNKAYGGTTNNEGAIDKTKPFFYIEGDKFTLQENNGKETIFEENNFVNPKKVSNMSNEYVNGQVDNLNKAVSPPSPFYPYVGSWAINFSAKAFGIPGYNDESSQRLTITFIDSGNSKFKVIMKSFDLVGNAKSIDITSSGSYTNPINSVFVSIALNDWDIKLVGDNLLEAQLKFSLLDQYKPFIGFKLNLQRVPSSDYTG